MLADPRFAAASGLAALAGAAMALAGRLELSVPVMVLLLAAATMAAPAAAPTQAPGAREAPAAAVPGWVLIAIWASLRAGSVHLADVRGAHAVAGIALVRGPVLLVAGAWIAAGAAALLVAAQPARGWARLAIPATLAQVAFAVTLVAGPQVGSASDAVPWVAATAGIGGVAWLVRHRERRMLLRAGTALAIVAAALGAFGGRL